MLLRNKPKPLLGLDISSTAVKLIELGGSRGDMRVESYAAVGLPVESVVDKQVINPEAVSEAIKKALKMAGTRTKDTCVAVGGSGVITKTVPMPAGLREDELEQQIQLDAEQYIPFPLDEVGLDFHVLGPTADGRNSVDVLIAACRRDAIENRVAAVELAGLHCKIVDIEAHALENACQLIREQLEGGGHRATIAFVDIGATTTTLNIMHEGSIIYTRDQIFGGKQLTEEIMRHYSLSYEEAGKAKRTGGLPDSYAQEVLQPFMVDTIQQVNRALQFFFSSHNQIDKIDQIILAGGCSSIPGIDEAVEQHLEVPTRIADPFMNMKISNRARPKMLKLDAPALMIACGLALRSYE